MHDIAYYRHPDTPDVTDERISRHHYNTRGALYRESYASLNLPAVSYQLIRDCREWRQFLEAQFQRRWKIHFVQKNQHARQNNNYLGHYLKRPPIM